MFWHLRHSDTVPCKWTIPLRGACPTQTRALTAALTVERCKQPGPLAVNEETMSHHVGPERSGALSCYGLDEPRGHGFSETPDTQVTSGQFRSYEMPRGGTSGDKTQAGGGAGGPRSGGADC